MLNSYQGQKIGPFNNGQNLLSIIITELGLPVGNYIIVKLGIQAKKDSQFRLKENSDETFRIGKTGIYEIEDVEITYLAFLGNNSDKSFIIDYILKEV